jgi:electron transfer flavoprotein alpha/beta subunit
LTREQQGDPRTGSPGPQPVDAIAAEAALHQGGEPGSKVTVISMGAESAQAAIKRVLAMGADEVCC